MRKTIMAASAVLLVSAGAVAACSAPGHDNAHAAAPTAHQQSRGVPVIAHRGAPDRAPENTLASIDKAAELGFTWVENDVQRTKDGELVVIHDSSLKRTTDAAKVFPGRAPWNVRDFTAAEIARLDAGSWYGPKFAGTRVPTLKEYVQHLSRHGQSLLMELKSPDLYPGIEQQTLAVLGEAGWLDKTHVRDRLVIQSFDANSIRRVHQLRPDIKTGFLGKPAKADLSKYAAFSDEINPQHAGVSADYVSAVHALKGPHAKPLEIYPWTINDASAAKRAVHLGADGIISSWPDVVRNALSADR